jgi:cytochrome c5
MRKWKLYTVACLMLSMSAGAVAQGEATDPNEPVSPNKASAGETAPAVNPGAQQDGSPFDYKSSEEISEDLSVSFPVDI